MWEIRKVPGGSIRLSDNKKYHFFICDDKIPSSYLCRDGQIRNSCNIDWLDVNKSGWYKTESEAKSAFHRYLNKDIVEEFVTNIRNLCNDFLKTYKGC